MHTASRTWNRSNKLLVERPTLTGDIKAVVQSWKCSPVYECWCSINLAVNRHRTENLCRLYIYTSLQTKQPKPSYQCTFNKKFQHVALLMYRVLLWNIGQPDAWMLWSASNGFTVNNCKTKQLIILQDLNNVMSTTTETTTETFSSVSVTWMSPVCY